MNQALETICTSLEMSKKLDEAGVRIPTHLSWQGSHKSEYLRLNYSDNPEFNEHYNSKNYFTYPAYTFSQIYSILPEMINLDYDQPERYGIDCPIFIDRFSGLWLVGYEGIREDDMNYSESMADAAGEALLWCLKEGYLKIENINY